MTFDKLLSLLDPSERQRASDSFDMFGNVVLVFDGEKLRPIRGARPMKDRVYPPPLDGEEMRNEIGLVTDELSDWVCEKLRNDIRPVSISVALLALADLVSGETEESMRFLNKVWSESPEK